MTVCFCACVVFVRHVRRVPVLWWGHDPVQQPWVLRQSKELVDRQVSDPPSPADVIGWIQQAAVHHWPVWTWRQTDWLTGNDVIHDVSLLISDDGYALVVGDDGAMTWTMRDFQTICRNVAINAGTNGYRRPM